MKSKQYQSKQYQIAYYGDYGNRYIMFTGSLEACKRVYSENIAICEEHNANIEPYQK